MGVTAYWQYEVGCQHVLQNCNATFTIIDTTI